MASRYSRRTFLRQTPNALIQKYLEMKSIAMPFAWEDLHETKVEPISEAIDTLPAAQAKVIDSDFALVMGLADWRGTQAILEEAQHWGLDWAADFAAMANDYERAMWTFVNEPRRFKVAGAFHQMDRVNFSWHRFVGRRLDVQVDDEATRNLSKAIKSHYRPRTGGRFCKVDVYRRTDPDRICFFAYPEDAPDADLGYQEDGELKLSMRQRVFEVIFVYRPEEGDLEMYARGVKAEKEKLAGHFCVHALGLQGLPDGGEARFDLSALADTEFEFATEPVDRVQSVDLRLLRLNLPFNAQTGVQRRLTLEAKSTPESPRALYRLMQETLNSHNIAMADVTVSRAKLCFTFRPVDNERPKTLTFEVGYPDRCTLKDDPYDQIARKYLHQWGIARDHAAVEVAEAS